jgi:hypothetical protein
MSLRGVLGIGAKHEHDTMKRGEGCMVHMFSFCIRSIVCIDRILALKASGKGLHFYFGKGLCEVLGWLRVQD